MLDMVVHAFIPNTREAEADISEFEARLVYNASSRTYSETLYQKTNKQPKTKRSSLMLYYRLEDLMVLRRLRQDQKEAQKDQQFKAPLHFKFEVNLKKKFNLNLKKKNPNPSHYTMGSATLQFRLYGRNACTQCLRSVWTLLAYFIIPLVYPTPSSTKSPQRPSNRT